MSKRELGWGSKGTMVHVLESLFCLGHYVPRICFEKSQNEIDVSHDQ